MEDVPLRGLRIARRARVVAVLAALALGGASCGGSGPAARPSTTLAAVTTTTASSSTATTKANPTIAELRERFAAAYVQPGKLAHLTMTVTEGEGSSPTTVQAWLDPQQGMARVERPGATPADEPTVEIVDAETAAMSSDLPIGVVLVLLGSGGPTPPAMEVRSDEVDGKPVTVVTWQVPGSDDVSASTITLVFDTDSHLVTETRESADGTRRIAYTTDFVDPASLPTGAFDAGQATGPPVDTSLPPGFGPKSPAELTAEAARAAGLGLDLRWLGLATDTWTLTDVMVNEPGMLGPQSPASAFLAYSPAAGSTMPEGQLQIAETTGTGWNALRQGRPDLATIEQTGTPVPGVGERAYLSTLGGPQATLVVFDGDLVVQLDLFAFAGDPSDVEAAVVATGQALRPVSEG